MTAHTPPVPRSAPSLGTLRIDGTPDHLTHPDDLDYYVLAGEDGSPEGLIVEEFAYADDHSATGIDGAVWTRREGHWRSSAGFIRGMRSDPGLRGRVSATDRLEAENVYRLLGGGELPDETGLRAFFHDRLQMNTGTPLQLGSPQAAEGFADVRTYRILFANHLRDDHLRDLRDLWRMTSPADEGPAQARVVGTARHHIGDDAFTWDLRHIGPGVAWCLDVTAYLSTRTDANVGIMLRGLMTPMRRAGLIPVTVERFS